MRMNVQMYKLRIHFVLITLCYFGCRTWTPIHTYKLNYNLIVHDDRFGRWAGKSIPNLRKMMSENPNFPYETATYDEILRVFGKNYIAKYTLDIPRVQIYRKEKFYIDQWIFYSSDFEPDPSIQREAKFRYRSYLNLVFYLFKGKVTRVFIDDKTAIDDVNFTKDTLVIPGQYNFYPSGWDEDHRRPNQCLEYFYLTLTLRMARGTDRLDGYERCEFDYDPEYWKDPIYQSIWDSTIMGTLEQLGIKEYHHNTKKTFWE